MAPNVADETTAVIFADSAGAKEIERLAAGLSREEVLDCYGVSEEELNQCDRDIFDRAYRKGRALAKARAVDALFVQMVSGKDGVKGSLSYLRQLGKEWEGEGESGVAGRILRIEME